MNTVLPIPKLQDPDVALSDLRARLQEAEDTLAAIRSGGVDAIVVDGPEGEKVFSLAGAERPYRLMIERMNEGAAMLREDGTIMFCNAMLASMLRSTPESVTGSNIHAHVCLDMHENLEAVLGEGARGGGKRELRLRSRSGSEVPALLAVSTLGSENAGMLCLLATDLSEQERREQELEDSHRQLSAVAVELQRSNSELRDFAAVAGHDLQQPLRRINTFAGELKTRWGDRLDDEARDVLERLSHSADRMRQLTDALLNYGQLHAQPEPPVPVRLEQVLRDVVADLEVAIRDSGARVQVGPLPEIIAEQAQMRQLFQNLVSNALKYRCPGVVPEVTVQGRLVSGNTVEIVVLDNGIGFDMQHAERIFRPFQRLVSEAEYDGVGLGLAICRKIVTQHGGSIRATSRPGQGSTFTITLPSGRVGAAALAAGPDIAGTKCSPSPNDSDSFWDTLKKHETTRSDMPRL